MARLAESAQMSEWVAKEDDFHLEQSRRRATIRVRENRAKPIDLLAINLKWADPVPLTGEKDEDADEEEEEAGLEIDLEEPYNIFDVSGPRLDACHLPCACFLETERQLALNSSCGLTELDPGRNGRAPPRHPDVPHSRKEREQSGFLEGMSLSMLRTDLCLSETEAAPFALLCLLVDDSRLRRQAFRTPCGRAAWYRSAFGPERAGRD